MNLFYLKNQEAIDLFCPLQVKTFRCQARSEYGRFDFCTVHEITLSLQYVHLEIQLIKKDEGDRPYEVLATSWPLVGKGANSYSDNSWGKISLKKRLIISAP